MTLLHLISIILAAVFPPIIGSDSENQVPPAIKSKTFKTLFDKDLFQQLFTEIHLSRSRGLPLVFCIFFAWALTFAKWENIRQRHFPKMCYIVFPHIAKFNFVSLVVWVFLGKLEKTLEVFVFKILMEIKPLNTGKQWNIHKKMSPSQKVILVMIKIPFSPSQSHLS